MQCRLLNLWIIFFNFPSEAITNTVNQSFQHLIWERKQFRSLVASDTRLRSLSMQYKETFKALFCCAIRLTIGNISLVMEMLSCLASMTQLNKCSIFSLAFLIRKTLPNTIHGVIKSLTDSVFANLSPIFQLCWVAFVPICTVLIFKFSSI